MNTFYLRLSIPSFFLLLLPFSVVSSFVQQNVPSVRVRLFESYQPASITIEAYNGSIQLFAGISDNPIALLREDQSTTIRISNRQLYFTIEDTGIYAESLRLEPVIGAQTRIDILDDTSVIQSGRYQGFIIIEPVPSGDILKLVNEIAVEDYVAAVLSSEYNFDEREGAKALAVLIRTHTLWAMNQADPEGEYLDTLETSWYRGAENIDHAILESVRQTDGQALTYEDAPIQALYHFGDIVNQDLHARVYRQNPSYIRSTGTYSSSEEWEARISRPRLLELLSEQYGFPVEGFNFRQRGPDERVLTIELLKSETERVVIGAIEFRSLILRNFGRHTVQSMQFTARRRGDTYVFTGRGTEDAVGLDPYGAHIRARDGLSFEEIIDFYYSGVSITEAGTDTQNDPETTRPARRGRIGW